MFQCRHSAQWDKDMFTSTGAYSPRNEAYINADRFLQLWYEVMGTEIEPFSELVLHLITYIHVQAGFYLITYIRTLWVRENLNFYLFTLMT